MSDRTPPLHLLRVFDVAGRTGSFKQAANELHVTPSAVSHQIKTLEEHLGFPVFRRLNRSLALTDAGKALHQTVHLQLTGLREGVSRVVRRYGEHSIRVHILPFMATEIVIPNLHHFQTAHPEIQLRIETSLTLNEIDLGDVDMGVRFGMGNWGGMASEKLLDVEVTPLCSPAFQKDHHLHTLDDLHQQTLINIPYEQDAWGRWAEQAGMQPLESKRQLTLDSYISNLSAAEQGLGVALGLYPLSLPWLKSGRLIKPFSLHIPIPEGYHLVYRPEDAERPDIKAFRKWMVQLFQDLKKQSDEWLSSEAY